MATIVTDILCDLTQPVKVQYLHGNLFSQDNAANTINVHVHSAGVPESLGGTISANVIRSDGGTVAVAGSVSGDTATVVLPQACYAVPGVIHIIIKSTVSSVVTTIAAVVANVYTSSTDTVVDPGTIITDVAALIDAIEDAVDSIPVDYSGLLATIAADYSSSKTYPVVGTYAWQGGVLKRNIVPITTAETYTAAHWTNAVIGDDISNLKSALSIVADDIGYTFFTDKTAFTFSGYMNGNGNYQANSGFLTTDYINLPQATSIIMTATTMDNLSNIVVYDENDNKVGKYTGSGSSALNTFKFNLPKTAKKVRFSIIGTDSVQIIYANEKIPSGTLWLAIGDSITVGYGNNNVSYADYAAQKLGIQLNKQAVSGSTIGAMYGRVVDGDFDGIKPEIITILGGTNDWNTNRLAKNTDTDTIYTAGTYLAYVNSIIETLQVKQPQAHIIMLSCLQRNYSGDDPSNISGTVNGNGETLDDYRNALLIGCKYHGVPVIDLYAESGLCGENLLPVQSGYNAASVTRLTIDGLHPNEAGQKRIADIVAGGIARFIV